MNFEYLKILLGVLAVTFICQACLPPPPPHYYHRPRHWHGSSQEQTQAVAQAADQEGGGFHIRGEAGQ